MTLGRGGALRGVVRPPRISDQWVYESRAVPYIIGVTVRRSRRQTYELPSAASSLRHYSYLVKNTCVSRKKWKYSFAFEIFFGAVSFKFMVFFLVFLEPLPT